jgi:signal transduction histidine kinase
MSYLSAEPIFRRAPSRQVVPYLVLALCVVASAATAYIASRTADVQEQLRFDNATRNVREAAQTRIETYLALLRAEAGLFTAVDEVRRDQFQAFAARLDLRGKYPGIQGIGFTTRVTAHELPVLVASMRAQGLPDFHVWPSDARPEYHSIIHLEPLDRRNAAAIGYDMYTEATRRAAMDKAARTGTAAASGKVTLVQEIEGQKQPGFLIYLPVYRRGMPLGSDAERSAALRGFVYSPFRAGDLLSHLFAVGDQRGVDVQVFDLHRDRPESLLFDSRDGNRDHEPRFVSPVRVDVAGRPWWIVVSSRPVLEQSPERAMAGWTLATGFALSLALFALVRLEVRARTSAEGAADSLQRSQAALHESATELERVVAAERVAHTEAAEANRVKDEFLATLSHELRTPLNAILGWATMLREGRLNPEQRSRALDVIERNARSQAELVDDLLDVSRIITGKLRLEAKPIDAAPAIEAAVDSVRPMAEAKGVQLEWRQETRGRVLGDPDRIQQIAWNLLSNAIKFTPSGGRVVASVRARDAQVEFAVTDNGVGIDPAFLPHVFERLRQADSSTTRQHGGLGLGLAIVRHLVEAHGGTVRAESAGLGHGTTFIVTLPLRQTSKAAASGQRTPRGSLTGQRQLLDARVLVLDDEADARDLISAIVQDRGGLVVQAASAGDAMDAMRSASVDLIIADIGMPGRDGLDFIRDVRSLPSDSGGSVPAIALTAYGRPEDRERALNAGFQVHMVKPVPPQDIVAVAEELLRGR